MRALQICDTRLLELVRDHIKSTVKDKMETGDQKISMDGACKQSPIKGSEEMHCSRLAGE